MKFAACCTHNFLLRLKKRNCETNRKKSVCGFDVRKVFFFSYCRARKLNSRWKSSPTPQNSIKNSFVLGKSGHVMMETVFAFLRDPGRLRHDNRDAHETSSHWRHSKRDFEFIDFQVLMKIRSSNWIGGDESRSPPWLRCAFASHAAERERWMNDEWMDAVRAPCSGGEIIVEEKMWMNLLVGVGWWKLYWEMKTGKSGWRGWSCEASFCEWCQGYLGFSIFNRNPPWQNQQFYDIFIFFLSFSQISRQSIDACKDYFRDDLMKSDWALMVELKKQFQIL